MYPPHEGDRSRMGLRGDEKSWGEIKDYNPDHNPSAFPIKAIERNGDVLMLIPVRGLGVICLRALDSWCTESGKLEFAGVSIFSKSDLGYCPDL